MCCSLVFVLLYRVFIELATINRYKTVSIRVSQIEPDPYIYTVKPVSNGHPWDLKKVAV